MSSSLKTRQAPGTRRSLARLTASLCSLALLGSVAAGCGEATTDEPLPPHGTGGDGKADASLLATFLNFEFDGQFVTDGGSAFGGRQQQIQDHLLYTIGHLNGNNSVGRLDKVELTNIQEAAQPDGKTLITYHAKLPVAWGSKTNVPTTYNFTLPRDMSYAGVQAFVTKYKSSCVDFGAHDVDDGSMWYYYRPNLSGCQLADTDVVKFTALAGPSGAQTTGKYPEYHKVWEDGVLKVVAIFGKFEVSGQTSSDAGIAAYNEFISVVGARLKPLGLTTTPATFDTEPGVKNPDITFAATLPDGKKVEVTALLVDSITAGSSTYDFEGRYNQLTAKADLIAYNGHAGLGQNVRALARKGSWAAGQYLMFFSNGCDTYAYVDGYLAQTRAALNPDDPTGSKYMDIITNAQPAFFRSDTSNTLALIDALMNIEHPLTYEDMFKKIDSSQVVLVTGEDDNVFTPAMWGGSTSSKLLEQSGTVTRSQQVKFQTGSLPAGDYLVSLEGDGDADLYVSTTRSPTTRTYTCRPYLDGSHEECHVTLSQPGTIYVMVRGYAASSSFQLTVE
jgi:hypothetical protein